MVRLRHKAIARICLFAMLFLQLGVAAYACPSESVSGTATVDMSADMAGCGGKMDQPGLCAQYRVSTASATKTIPDPLRSPLVASLVAPSVDMHAAARAGPPLAVKRTATAAGPPAYLRFQALRL